MLVTTAAPFYFSFYFLHFLAVSLFAIAIVPLSLLLLAPPIDAAPGYVQRTYEPAPSLPYRPPAHHCTHATGDEDTRTDASFSLSSPKYLFKKEEREQIKCCRVDADVLC